MSHQVSWTCVFWVEALKHLILLSFSVLYKIKTGRLIWICSREYFPFLFVWFRFCFCLSQTNFIYFFSSMFQFPHNSVHCLHSYLYTKTSGLSFTNTTKKSQKSSFITGRELQMHMPFESPKCCIKASPSTE